MKKLSSRWGKIAVVAVLLSAGAFASVAYATHSWGSYHWARAANPFLLKLGDNVSAVWDSHLLASSLDWSASLELDTAVVTGMTNPKTCKAVNGRVEVCNSKYGNNGWLGIASIWVSGDHITKAAVKLNDTYFNTAKYNTPAWRQFVVCQEVGHAFGLDHQDEVFDNTNLGTCMDYTSDPDGSILGQLDNQHPNAHDYEELGAIYAHLDAFTTIFSSIAGNKSSNPLAEEQTADSEDEADTDNPSEWGQLKRNDQKGRGSLYEKDLGKGKKLFTFVVWAD